MKLNEKEIEAIESLVVNEIDFFEHDCLDQKIPEIESEGWVLFSTIHDKLNHMKEELIKKGG